MLTKRSSTATQPRIVDLNASIRDLEPMVRRLVGENIQFEIALLGDLGRVRVDPARLQPPPLALFLAITLPPQPLRAGDAGTSSPAHPASPVVSGERDLDVKPSVKSAAHAEGGREK
jgi:hypothetical protein